MVKLSNNIANVIHLRPPSGMSAIVSAWWSRIALIFLFVVAAFGAVAWLSLHPLLASSILLGLMLAATIGIERVRGNAATSGLVWHTNTMRLVGYGTLLAVVLITAVILIALALGGAFINVQPLAVGSVITAILVIIVNSSLEELVFRGTAFEALHERFGALPAVLSTSVLFALLHMLNPYASVLSVTNTALAGVLLGALVAQSHSLYAAIAFHAVWNVLVGLVVGSVSGLDMGIGLARLDLSAITPAWLIGDAYGIEEGALTTVLLIAAVLVVVKTVPLDAETRAARYRHSFSRSNNSAT